MTGRRHGRPVSRHGRCLGRVAFPDGARVDIDNAYRMLAKTRHPDSGGSHAMMAELNAARDAAMREIG